MENPYLIQRAKFANRGTNRIGIDSILSFDYMGSSEFEFGALPKSLARIREAENLYIFLDVPIGDKTISVLCKDSEKSNIREYLTNLAERKNQLKEFSAFDAYIKDYDGYFADKFDFWWDIINDIMFWKKSPDFESEFKPLLWKAN